MDDKILNTAIPPTQLVILGATGDLMAKKITPALFHLFEKGQLPKMFRVVGFARRQFSQAEFGQTVFDDLTKHPDVNLETCGAFCELFSFESGLFENKNDYQNLAQTLKQVDDGWGVCSNKLFYLAVPPQFYEPIFRNLAASGLTRACSAETGWTRVIVEKPFGRDLKTAERLDLLLSQLFQEIQIYRLDHYLAKEMLQNILAFRFTNNLFETNWGRGLIEKVHIRLLEKIGVEERGRFYDGVGALRDVGQNHLLQMAALVAMKFPGVLAAGPVRQSRAEILESLQIPKATEIAQNSFRARYGGYSSIEGVAPDSTTETYFKIRAFLNHPNWQGVPFILEGGKRLPESIKEIEVTFRHPCPCLCPPDRNIHYKNRLIFRLEPQEGIDIEFWSKKPGLALEVEERTFNFLYRHSEKKAQYTEEYEKLLLDCIGGDQTLFTSSREIAATWKFIDPILEIWQNNKVPLKEYEPETDTILLESKFVEVSLPARRPLKKEIGIIGLGKMGANLARRLLAKGWRVVGYNRTAETTKELAKEGLEVAYSLPELIKGPSRPRVICLMIPSGKAVEETLFGSNGLASLLEKGDVVIDGGNSFYKDSRERFNKLKTKGIHFLDVGVSGGPEGALNGSALMVGGDKEIYQKLEPLFYDLASPQGYQFFAGAGAGHFVKMVHNGIEYGMMQALAEGFTLLRKINYKLDLNQAVDVYNHGSVIESRLVGWLKNAFELHGPNLDGVSGSVGQTGEGAWTVQTAKQLGVKTKIIEEALKFRLESKKDPSYTGRILSALREQFGGHRVENRPL